MGNMKTNRIGTENHERVSTSLLRACLNTCSAIRDGIETAKEKIFRQYEKSFGEQERLLRLALNEAEALAWQTDFPHLLFPTLAMEKVETAVHWQRRQNS